MDDDRKWFLAWAQFDAFAKNLPGSIEEKHVAEYHSILDLFRQVSGEDIAPFRIPAEEVKPVAVMATRASFRGPGRIAYSHLKYCDHNLMVRRLDTVRMYFDRLAPATATTRFGF